VRVRPATPDDVAEVTALEAELFGVDAWSTASVSSELTGERRSALVACDPHLVGYVVTRHVDDAVDLQRIAVAASHRRQGLATRLLAEVTTSGRMLLDVSVANEGAIGFYLAEGFAEIARRARYYRDGSDAVVMERTTQ
jgi:ribosomal protein S18 acetylase RimI-like enzyme